MAYDIGGGGGKAGAGSDADKVALSKPYDISGEMTPEKMQQLNEMLQTLFDNQGKQEDVGVRGPAVTVAGHVALWDDTKGTKLKDAGVFTYSIAVLDLTAAQLSVATTYTIVAAPGAGKILVPLLFSASREVTGAFSAAGTGADLQYDGISTNIVAISGLNLTTVGTRHYAEAAAAIAITSDPSNKALVVDVNTTMTAGTLRNNAIRFSVFYYTIDTPYYPPTTN